LKITSSSDNVDLLRLECTDTGSNNFGPIINLKRTAAGGASDNDKTGQIEFTGTDDLGNSFFTYGSIDTIIEDSANGSRDGKLRFGASEGSTMKYLEWDGSVPAFQPDADDAYNLGYVGSAWLRTYSKEYAHYTGSTWLDGVGDGASLFLWQGEVFGNPGTWELQLSATTGGVTGFGYQPLPPSQLKYKENITDFTLGVDFLESLSPIHYDFKDSVEEFLDRKPLKNQLGFTVEAFEDVPALVSYITTHTVDDDKTTSYIPPKEEFKTIDYNKLHKDMNYALINAVKELSAKNDALEARIAALEAA